MRLTESDSAESSDHHSLYLAWNTALAEHFFRPEMAGRRVVLFVSDDVIAEVGANAALDPESFVASVKAGVPWGEREGVCYRALDAFEGWRSKDLPYPPYLAALCMFVLAVGIEAP